MKTILIYVIAIISLLGCRANEASQGRPECVTRALNLIGVDVSAAPGEKAFDKAIYEKLSALGERGKVIDWLCSESDSKQIGFVLDYKNSSFILSFTSVEKGLGNTFFLQLDFDSKQRLARIYSRLQPLGPYP